MSLSQSDLRLMAGAASTIPERLNSQIIAEGRQENAEPPMERLSAWCQIAAGGNQQHFQERLCWDGLDLAGAQRLLDSDVWCEPLPAWTATLQEALHLLEEIADDDIFAQQELWPFLDSSKPLPFETLLAPFVQVARRRFLAQARAASTLLTAAAHLTLQRHLLQVLTSLAIQTLHSAYLQEAGAQGNETGCYQQFLHAMCRGGLATLLRTYNVLARLLATTCDLWVATHVEWVQRLLVDWSDLQETFGRGTELGEITAVEPALSDVHAGRRAVMAITFASGDKIVYKPRSIDMEEGFSRLLSWCNAQRTTPPFKVLATLKRFAYGWVEYVTYEPCQDGQALRRYYQRAGMLLCLVYVLGGTNCFYDQWIAHGEQPVLVDASSLLQPYLNPGAGHRLEADWESARYSILHTGLLASWRMPPTVSSRKARYSAREISGLNLCPDSNCVTTESKQTSASEQLLTLKYGLLKRRMPLNAAFLAGEAHPVPEKELHEHFLQGIQHMYQTLLRNRTALLAAESPFQIFREQIVRVVYRDHSIYEGLLPKLLAPQALRDAVTRSMLLEHLGSRCVPTEWHRTGKRNDAHWWSVFTAERQALLQGTIPVVNARADSTALLIAPDLEVVSCLYQPAFDLLLRRLEGLSEQDMRQQLLLVQQILCQKRISVVSGNNTVEQSDTGEDARLFLEKATAIADDIARHAVEVGPGNVILVDVGTSQRTHCSQLQPMPYGLSDGVSGTALFLAALASETGHTAYEELARALLQPLLRLVRDEGMQLVLMMGLGAGPGLGSVIYALTRISQFLDEPELLATARAAARLLTPELIKDDRLLDVFLGGAGALLGLVTLYMACREQEVLDLAMSCARHLLRNRAERAGACCSWPTLFGQHTTGFAHGAAGIAYALLRLYALTGETALIGAAQEGLCYENCALLPTVGNWLEVVGGDETEVGVSWCHGAPGIGLARLGILPILDTPLIRRDIEIALQTTQQIGVAGPDHLCCGTAGRAEFLLAAAQRLGRPELTTLAADWFKQVLTRAQQRGGYILDPSLPAWVPHLQLFRGTAGIGYTLLRLAQPGVLPSLLLWE